MEYLWNIYGIFVEYLWNIYGYLWDIPSGKHTKTMERSTMFNGKTHYKWPFSIAMLVYQMVIPHAIVLFCHGHGFYDFYRVIPSSCHSPLCLGVKFRCFLA